ncbi:MAG TPA: hypothetical protein VFM33_13380, partial [Aquabacterium sp.]|nr:hypothetical protein [Aquabacterium sp.]
MLLRRFFTPLVEKNERLAQDQPCEKPFDPVTDHISREVIEPVVPEPKGAEFNQPVVMGTAS